MEEVENCKNYGVKVICFEDTPMRAQPHSYIDKTCTVRIPTPIVMSTWILDIGKPHKTPFKP